MQELIHDLRNGTDRQSSAQYLTALSERIDAVQSAVADLQTAQKNVTVTLGQVLRQMDGYLKNVQNSSSLGHH